LLFNFKTEDLPHDTPTAVNRAIFGRYHLLFSQFFVSVVLIGLPCVEIFRWVFGKDALSHEVGECGWCKDSERAH